MELPKPELSDALNAETVTAYGIKCARVAQEVERAEWYAYMRGKGKLPPVRPTEPRAALALLQAVYTDHTIALPERLARQIKKVIENAAHPPVQPTEPRPWVSLSESEIMRLWRDAGLPEYFLGNGGSNAHLCQFAALVIAESRCRNGFANPPVQPTEPK